jgi:hypothetical protein
LQVLLDKKQKIKNLGKAGKKEISALMLRQYMLRRVFPCYGLKFRSFPKVYHRLTTFPHPESPPGDDPPDGDFLLESSQ